MKVISFHNEVQMINDLVSETILLIHHTEVVNAIKKLIDAHDILELALRLERQYEDFNFQPPWCKATSQDLDLIRSELIARYADAFKRPMLLPKYYSNMGRLLKTMELRNEG